MITTYNIQGMYMNKAKDASNTLFDSPKVGPIYSYMSIAGSNPDSLALVFTFKSNLWLTQHYSYNIIQLHICS